MILLTVRERNDLLRILTPELRLLNRLPQQARWDLLDRLLNVMPTPGPERVRTGGWISPLELEVLRSALRGDTHLLDDFPARPQVQARRFVAWANGPTLREQSCQVLVDRSQKFRDQGQELVALTLLNQAAHALTESRISPQKYRLVTFALFMSALGQALSAANRRGAQALEWPPTIDELTRRHSLERTDKHVTALRLLEEVIKLIAHFAQTPAHRNDPQRWQRLAAMSVHAGLLATPLPWGQDEPWETLAEHPDLSPSVD